MKYSSRVLICFAFLLASILVSHPGQTMPADYAAFPHLSYSIEVAGENLAVEGFPLFGQDYFAVCNKTAGLIIYQVNGSDLDQVSTFSGLGQELDIEVRDWTGYLVTTGGLTVVSLAIVQTPISQGFLSLPGGDLKGLTVSDTHAFVACGTEGLAIVDITDPNVMTVAAWYGDDVVMASLDGDRLGVINNGRFELVDVSDPALPVLLGFCATVSLHHYVAGVTQGSFAYTHAGGQVDRWDFSDPANPVLDSAVPSIDLPSTIGGTLEIQGAELQITGANYLGHFDFATGALLRETRQVWLPRAVDVQAGLRVASAPEALHVYQDGTLSHPAPAGTYDPTGSMIPAGIMLGDILYGRSLVQPRTVTALDLNSGAGHLWDFDSGFPTGNREMIHRGNLIALLSWSPYHVKLISVSRHGALERGSLALADLDPADDAMVFLGDNHLVVYDSENGSTPANLRVLDISNPDDPREVNNYLITSTSHDTGIWATDSVIMFGSRHHLELVDARNPLDLTPGAAFNLGAQFLFIAENWLYSVHPASYGAILKSWDLSDPLQPVVAGELPLARLTGFASHGHHAYQEETGLVLDLSDPAHPVPAGNLSLANPTINSMDRIIAGDQYILTGDLSDAAPYATLHYLAAQGGTGEVSPVADGTPTAGTGFRLKATPNPFNPRVTLKFELPATAVTKVDIFDVRGRLVATLGEMRLEAGRQSATWEGTDRAGRDLPSGVYLARVRAGAVSESLKIVLAR